MKISPLTGSGGAPGQVLGNVEIGRTANTSKMARAKAIAAGQQVEPPTKDLEEVTKAQANIKSIKMNTQRSTDRDMEALTATEPAAETIESSVPVTTEATVEETKPLSPQFAALAKQRRALQLERAQLDKDKAALANQVPSTGNEELINRLKSQPLSVLQEHGVTYDQLTEALLANPDGSSQKIRELETKLAAMEQGLEKKLTDRDTQAENAALDEMRKEATRLARDGDGFELVRETGSVKDVVELIHRTWKKTGEILDVHEAMQLVEDELINESLKIAKLKKVQGKLNPEPSPVPVQTAPQPQMRTLTNRDNSTMQMSRRQRALAAFAGTLKR